MTRSWVKTLTSTLAFTALLFSAFLAVADVAVPPLKSRVTDLSGTLSANEAVQLEQKLAAFEAKKGSQIAVLIVPTTQPETIEQYSIRVAEAWKLGRKGIDDGALLVIAKQDRTLRIEVGYGLEGVLPDAIAKRIIEETIVPKLRQGNFAGAIDAGIEKIMSVIQGEPLPPPPARHAERGGASNDAGGVLDNLFFIFIVLIVAGRILQSLFGRFVGASLTSASAGFLGWLLFSSIAAGIIIAVLAFFLSLFGSSGGGFYRGGPGGWYGGGGFGGRGGGGFGGGGGFSGGGGGFGGGGASGRW
ncbi:MAG TPA: YgcG family protein [Nitrosospira sp.]